ncbi:MAG: ATP-dependent DNA helicase RecG [Bacteroidales bacterium]|nr:ATP-dependent DNA helicase RecG [Bacteroidales bacterium]
MNKILLTDIQYLSGVGPRRAHLLETELGISTYLDLIRFFPYRYVDRSNYTPIAAINADMPAVQFRAKVLRAAASAKKLSVIVSDGSASIELVFFKGVRWVVQKLTPGSEFVFYGKPTVFGNSINIVHPEIDPVPAGVQDSQAAFPVMTGVYSSTEKIHNAGITSKVFARLVRSALDICLPAIAETLPDYILREERLVSLPEAIATIHFPTRADRLDEARRRLKFEELLLLELSLLKQKYVRSRSVQGIPLPKVGEAFNKCYEALPYELTGAQKRVIREIREDMRGPGQMNRLLQGDVGSGKTMVAVLSALIAVGNGYQACIMAPTEVLAQQHFRNISKYLEPTGVGSALLTGSTTARERRTIHSGLEDGSIGIIIGTHALIEDDVKFHNLALAIVDEQHRFGVDQRSKLWAKTSSSRPPHVLVMTATPIPRTLAMTLYGDLDVSVIDEMPPGRKPVMTKHIFENQKENLYVFMREHIARGRQVFVVYPLIFENEKLDYQNIENGFEEISRAFPFPPYKTVLVHGKQTAADKQFNMDAFSSGRAHILVATSVIEVGVDVPNASVMVIQSAERFGLSQLHQLRGRVGRGSEKSYCILVTGDKLSKESRSRIELMCRTENGFTLADEDLKMRGPGDLDGTQQSGFPIELRIASLLHDSALLTRARSWAEKILAADPTLSAEANSRLAAAINESGRKDYSKIS